jgi:hypothetical protein
LEWLAHTDPSKTWSAPPNKLEATIRMFDVSTTIQVGYGASTLFWKDSWLQGCSIKSLFLGVFAAVNKRVAKTRLVAEALGDD